MNLRNRWITTLLVCLTLVSTGVFAETTPAEQALRIFDESGVRGGLVVHLNCDDGHLTAALRPNDAFVVQGLSRNAKDVAEARAYIQNLGRYGDISVDTWIGDGLPYTDNLVNLFVVEKGTNVSREEILRALAPGGVALVTGGWLKKERFEKIVKPWPAEMDEWQHYLHGADNNAVAQDSLIGPPRYMQWFNGPMYARSHETDSSLAAMVSAGGRVFYIWDDGPTGLTDPRFPSKWALIARDAFNGVTLWKRPIPHWGWREWHDAEVMKDKKERARGLRNLPLTTTRRLVAAGERVYVTLGYEAPVSELDAATGEVLRTFTETKWADEILYLGDRLILRLRTSDSPPEKVWNNMPQRQAGLVVALDLASGRELWRSKFDTMVPQTLASSQGRVFYSNYDQIVCLDLSTGEEQWRSGDVAQGHFNYRQGGGTLVAHGDYVFYNRHVLHCLSAETGEVLWKGPANNGPGCSDPEDLFVIDNLVWTGETRLPIDKIETEAFREGLDLATGAVQRMVRVPKLISPGHHYRCYRSKATERYIILPKRGAEFVDLKGDNHMRNDWVRPPCIFGFMPANGLLYAAPHQCVCYPGVLLSNFNALTAQVTKPESDNIQRLVQGPAWQKGTGAVTSHEDWPMYRCNPKRGGAVATNISATLDEQWRVKFDSDLTPPVVADGRLLVAEKDRHVIHALDATNGALLWDFTTGGRIDSPPTVYQGLVLVGCGDGWVYCVHLSDGAEVWRFMAAPQERLIMAYGQVESAWPVHGSVLVQADRVASPPRMVAYCTAGRSTYLDGGIYVYGLNPLTGEVLYDTCLEGPYPDPMKDTGYAGYMDGAKTDLLVSDGADLYLLQERLRSDLKRLTPPMYKFENEYGGYRDYPAEPERGAEANHLIATGGLLDENYNEGAFWAYDDKWPGWDRHMNNLPFYGQLLSFNDTSAYGVHVFVDSAWVRRAMTPGDKGYRLYGRTLGENKDRWSRFVPLRIRAMVLAGDKLVVSGTPDLVPEEDPLAALEGRRGAQLMVVSAADGQSLAPTIDLEASPVFDGMIAANGQIYLSTEDDSVICLGPSQGDNVSAKIRRKVSRTELQREPWRAWNAFIDLIATESYEDLDSIQRVAHLAFWYDAEVQNGGHFQYFENRDTDYCDATLKALTVLGATKQHDLLEQAITLFENEEKEEIRTVDEFAEAALDSGYDDLDTAYYTSKPTLVDLLENYLEKYRDSFIEII